MAEFERALGMPAPREIVFDLASDPTLRADWMPHGLSLRGDEPGDETTQQVTAEGPLVPDAPRDGFVDASPDQLRLEWASRGDGRYSGWLQVADEGAGASEATIHLSFLGDQAQTHGGQAAQEVEDMLGQSLERLRSLVDQKVQDGG